MSNNVYDSWGISRVLFSDKQRAIDFCREKGGVIYCYDDLETGLYYEMEYADMGCIDEEAKDLLPYMVVWTTFYQEKKEDELLEATLKQKEEDALSHHIFKGNYVYNYFRTREEAYKYFQRNDCCSDIWTITNNEYDIFLNTFREETQRRIIDGGYCYLVVTLRKEHTED